MLLFIDIVLLGVVYLADIGIIGKVVGRTGVFFAVIPGVALNDVLDVS